MKKIILMTGMLAGGLALSATVFANSWLLYLPAILAGSQGGGTIDPPVVTGALNDTGIITTVGDTGKEDADYGRDANSETNNDADGHAGFNFTKLAADGSELDASATSWVCVQDNITGLLWSPDQGDSVNWTGSEEVVSNANTNELCGKTDWRLPEVKELLGIISYDADSYQDGNTIDITYFDDTQVGDPADKAVWYWTATAAASKQWGVTFQPIYNDTEKSASLSTLSTDELTVHSVRLVSGSVKTSNFTELDGGSTVQDNNTGLIWKRCLEGQTFSNGGCSATGIEKTWEQALALDDGTWRIPNIKELQSIFGEEAYFPTSELVWSSSPYAGNTQNSWIVDFASGLLWKSISQDTTDSVYVRLVRDAPTE